MKDMIHFENIEYIQREILSVLDINYNFFNGNYF